VKEALTACKSSWGQVLHKHWAEFVFEIIYNSTQPYNWLLPSYTAAFSRQPTVCRHHQLL